MPLPPEQQWDGGILFVGVTHPQGRSSRRGSHSLSPFTFDPHGCLYGVLPEVPSGPALGPICLPAGDLCGCPSGPGAVFRFGLVSVTTHPHRRGLSEKKCPFTRDVASPSGPAGSVPGQPCQDGPLCSERRPQRWMHLSELVLLRIVSALVFSLP